MEPPKPMYEIEIEGPPVSWKAHGGYGRHSFNPRFKEKEKYQWLIRKQYRPEFPLTVAVQVTYFYQMPIPASTSKRNKEMMLAGRVTHIKRPDLDNLNKFLSDCLKGIIIQDDSQIMELRARKFYSENPRTIVHIDIAGFGDIC